MKKLSLYIPLDYVATRVDLVVMALSCLFMLGLGVMMWDARVEVPPEPKKLVLRSAYVTHPLDRSKSSAFLYFTVGQDEGVISTGLSSPVRMQGCWMFRSIKSCGWL